MKQNVFQENLHLHMLVGKYRNKKYIIGLNLELEKLAVHDFPHPHNDPRTRSCI
jgi:hypothetical protein